MNSKAVATQLVVATRSPTTTRNSRSKGSLFSHQKWSSKRDRNSSSQRSRI